MPLTETDEGFVEVPPSIGARWAARQGAQHHIDDLLSTLPRAPGSISASTNTSNALSLAPLEGLDEESLRLPLLRSEPGTDSVLRAFIARQASGVPSTSNAPAGHAAPRPAAASPPLTPPRSLHDEQQQQQEQWCPPLLSWDAESGASGMPLALLSDHLRACDSSDNLHEALILSLDPSPSSSSLPNNVVPVHAPARPEALVLASAQLALRTHASEHFAWHERHACFVWGRTLARKEAARAHYRHKHLAGKGKAAQPRDEDEVRADMLAHPWLGAERVRGMTAAASDAALAPLLQIGSLRRRLSGRIAELRDTSAKHAAEAPEEYALAAALETVLEWIGTEIDARDAPESIAVAARGLEEPLGIISALADLVGCGLSRRPPFRPLAPRPSSTERKTSAPATTAAHLSRVYVELSAQVATHASPLRCAALAFILEHTSGAWRHDVARWLGWPGQATTALHEEQELRGQKGSFVPWAGAEVEWERDARGEVDMGYVLRTSCLPAFLPLSSARDLLEAGRALRLLRRSAPPSHPLLLALSPAASRSTQPLPTPKWLWSEGEAAAQLEAVQARVRLLRRDVARWRRDQGQALYSSRPTSSRPPTSDGFLGEESVLERDEVRELQPKPLLAGDANSFEAMMALFDAAPGLIGGGSPAPLKAVTRAQELPSSTIKDTAAAYPPTSTTASLQGHLRHGAVLSLSSSAALPAFLPSSSLASLSDLTHASLVAPMQIWARLLNSALISSFYRDLGLATYLETCRRFLLLGSARFQARVAEVLFEAPEEEDDHLGVARDELGVTRLEKEWAPGLSARLNKQDTWPPNGSEVASALNMAVLETLVEMRADDTGALEDESSASSGLTAQRRQQRDNASERKALHDLDDRLSFAIIRPEVVGKGPGSHWRDKHSIDGLDWLTLNFHPPPLIAPLLPVSASLRYQRLFNYLLRLIRTQTVLASLFRDIIKGERLAPTPRAKGARAARPQTWLPFEEDTQAREVLLRFRHEANHIVTAIAGFTFTSIDDGWSRFQARLTRLRTDAEARDDSAFGRATDEDIGDEPEEAQNEAANVDEDLHGGSVEIKDVFSLARFHERTLEKLLQTCFLRARQRAIINIIDDILDGVLKLAALVREERRAHANGDKESTSGRVERLKILDAKWSGRCHLLVRALHLVRERGSGTSERRARAAAAASAPTWRRQDEAPYPARNASATARAEQERMEKQAQRDLELLEGGEDLLGGDFDSVTDLLARLDLQGRRD